MTADLATLYAAHLAALQAAHDRLLADHQLDALIVAAGRPALVNRFDDRYWPLAPTPTFAHWLPLPEADAVLVIRAGARPRLVRVATADFWESPPPLEADHFWSGFEVVEVHTPEAIAGHLPTGRVAVIASDELAFAAPGPLNPPAVVAAVHAVRTRKTPYELACLTEATRRAVRGHRAAASRFAADAPSELGLLLAYLDASEQDATATPYASIVARGRNAAVLHHVHYARRAPAAATDSLLVDAGASYLGYASDITRTWVRGDGEGAALFAALVDGVDRLQRQVCGLIVPGLEYEALHDRSHELLAALLVELGIGKAPADALVARGVTRALFPHGLGHSLGLQVHDVGMKPRAPRPDNPFLRNTSVIEVGQVFTIEPGCYVIDQLLAPLRADDRASLVDWAAIDRLRPFGGVRVEDDVVVTDAGIRNLTREAWEAA